MFKKGQKPDFTKGGKDSVEPSASCPECGKGDAAACMAQGHPKSGPVPAAFGHKKP